MTSEPSCSIEGLIALADGQLDAGEATAVRAHADQCATCSRSLAEVRVALALTAAAPVPAFGTTEAPGFVHHVRRGIRERYDMHAGWWRRPWASLAAGAAAGAICAVLVLGTLGQPAEAPGPLAAPAEAGRAAPGGASADSAAVWPDPSEDGDRLWASALDAYLIDTATDAELLFRMESLLEDEAVLTALLAQ